MPRLVGGKHQFGAFYFAIELLLFTTSSILIFNGLVFTGNTEEIKARFLSSV
jgi:hypothetical protein